MNEILKALKDNVSVDILYYMILGERFVIDKQGINFQLIREYNKAPVDFNSGAYAKKERIMQINYQ